MIRRICIGLFFLSLINAEKWSLKLNTTKTQIHVDSFEEIVFNLTIPENISGQWKLVATSSKEDLVDVKVPEIKDVGTDSIWSGKIKITGLNIGKTEITLGIVTDQGNIKSFEVLTVTIIRPERLIDTLFVISVAGLVSILYINFGCAMDWKATCETMKRPIGPLIGGVCQFIIMPFLAFGIGHILFPDNPAMQIGIFFTGISPSGGASNIWTLLLGGNLNMSIAMTTLSTLGAFVTIPLWVFTLGKSIFDKGNLRVPYHSILNISVSLLLPLAIGYMIQKKFPKLCKILVRIMKTCSVVLILFIVIFAVVTNFYLFKLFSWRIILAGMALPWLGFICGLISMCIFQQPLPDVKAIAIETGIQNTGISIFLLKFSMVQPDADLTTVIPVSVAVMTPIPLLILWMIKAIFDKKKKKVNGSSEQLQGDNRLPVTMPVTK